MGKKLLSLIGIGAGTLLVRKELKKNPEGSLAKVISSVTENPAVKKATETTKNKATKVIQKQGEAVTDKVAEVVKERLFGAQPKSNDPEPIYVDVEVEEIDPTEQSGTTPASS